MNIFTETEFTLFLKEINKSKMVFEIREEEIFLCSTLNGYEEEVSVCELAKLSEEFLIEKYNTWLNINTHFYSVTLGNKLVLKADNNSKKERIKFSHETIIGFDEMRNFIDIKNKAIVDYIFQIYKSKIVQ